MRQTLAAVGVICLCVNAAAAYSEYRITGDVTAGEVWFDLDGIQSSPGSIAQDARAMLDAFGLTTPQSDVRSVGYVEFSLNESFGSKLVRLSTVDTDWLGTYSFGLGLQIEPPASAPTSLAFGAQLEKNTWEGMTDSGSWGHSRTADRFAHFDWLYDVDGEAIGGFLVWAEYRPFSYYRDWFEDAFNSPVVGYAEVASGAFHFSVAPTPAAFAGGTVLLALLGVCQWRRQRQSS